MFVVVKIVGTIKWQSDALVNLIVLCHVNACRYEIINLIMAPWLHIYIYQYEEVTTEVNVV